MSKETDNNEPESDVTPKGNPTKKVNGLIFIGVLFVIGVFISYRPSLEKVHCDDEQLALKPEIIMLGAWWCPYCYKARNYIQNNNISYCEYDIETSEKGEQLYEQTGATAIPVLIIGRKLLQGFNENSVEKALLLTRQQINTNNDPL